MEVFKDIVGNYWKNAIIFILLLVLGCSCSTRKVETNKTKEETKTEQIYEVKNDIETVINDETNEIEVEPIDTSKVLIINGKTYKNAKVKITNRKAKTVIKDKTKIKNKTVALTKKKSKEKVTERKRISFMWLLLLLIPIIYLYVKKKI